MTALDEIRRACARMRRYSDSRWAQAPRAPMGALVPSSVIGDGPSLESRVRSAVEMLMRADATARGVEAFTPALGVFGLADALEALARSVAENGEPAAQSVLEEVAAASRAW